MVTLRRPAAVLVAGLAILRATIDSAGADCAPPPPRIEAGLVTIPPGARSRRDTLEAMALLLGAKLRWPADTPDSMIDPAMSGVPLEQALARLLDGLDWTVVWQRVPDADRMRWRPVEIRIGPSSPSSLSSTFSSVASGPADRPPESLEYLFDRLRRAADERGRRELADAIAAAASTSADALAVITHWLDSSEPEHVRAIALDVASRLADDTVLKRLEQQYRDRGDATAYGNVLELIRRARSEHAVPALIEWAGDIETQPASPRARAALQGLASVGTAPSVDFILDRFESAPTEVRDALRDALLAAAPTPTALAALRSAAEGRRGADSNDVRIAALDSLARFPDSLTVDLVRRLATSDPSPAVRTRAARLAEAWTAPAPSRHANR